MRLVSLLVMVFGVTLVSNGWAAGNGAGAGGAGHQRSINSGLPPGEPGPRGAVNNRTLSAPAKIQTAPATPAGSPAPKDQ